MGECNTILSAYTKIGSVVQGRQEWHISQDDAIIMTTFGFSNVIFSKRRNEFALPLRQIFRLIERILKINNSWPKLFNFQNSFNCH